MATNSLTTERMMELILALLLLFVVTVESSQVYLGCYVDGGRDTLRALPMLKYSSSGDMTVEICANLCGEYRYFGLQYARECWCGDSGYDRYGRGSGCDQACFGNLSQICGGDWRNSVYRIVPQFGDISLEVRGHNSSCVSLNWSEPPYPGGVIGGYYIRCQNRSWHQQLARSELRCGYQAYSQVRCYVKAFSEVGNSTAAQGVGRTNCSEPSRPEYYVLSSRGTNRTAVLMLYLQNSRPHCLSISHYNIAVTTKNGSLVYHNTSGDHGEFRIPNLDAFADYTVLIEVVNDANLISSSIRNIVPARTQRL